MAPVDISVSDDKVWAQPAPAEGHPCQTSDNYLAMEAVPLEKVEASHSSILLPQILKFPACHFSDSTISMVAALMINI